MKIPTTISMVAATAIAALTASLGTVPATSATDGITQRDDRTAAASQAARPTDRLDWGRCPEDVASPGLRCSTLEVPLNYGRPNGRTIEIAISRLRSTDPDKRRGVLLTNVGGPGGAGLAYPRDLATGVEPVLEPLPASVRKRYDIIGFDPRGVGRSAPVTCDLPEDYFSTFPAYARNDDDVTRQAELSERVTRGCATSRTAKVLPHINTVNTAEDMDRIRVALGEEKVSYFGISYGTYLGAVYTNLFPERSDRFVLESALSPGGWDLAFQRGIAPGVEKRFPDFAAWAAARPEYGLGSTPSQVRASYDRIAAKLDEAPLPGGYTGAAFRQITFASLYYDYKFPGLAAEWQALDQGVAPTTARSSRPSREADSMENYLSSQLAVICNDSVWPDEVSTYRRNVRIDRQRFPIFGGSTANISPCAFWPTQPQSKVQITDRGPSNVLIAQNLRDPATPLSGARMLRRAFGDRARMVTADQGGHLGFQRFLNQCLDDTVTRFLTTGQRPPRDRRCAAEPGAGRADIG